MGENIKNKVETLFEFTQEGYNERRTELNKLIERERQLAKEIKGLSTLYADNAKSLKELGEARAFYEKTLNSSSTLKARDAFVGIKNAQTAARAEAIKLNEEQVKLNKSYAQTKKQIKDTEESVKLYKTVLAELSKGMENANVSLSSLTKAQKILKKELSEPGINTQRYQELSGYLAQVNKVINTLSADLRNSAKSFGVTEAEMKQAEQAAENYRLVMAELSKEQKDATVTTNQLLQVQRYLKDEMGGKSLNSAEYKQMSLDLDKVTSALRQNSAEMKTAAKLAGVHENSIAALKIRLTALRQEIDKMDMGSVEFTQATKAAEQMNKELKNAEAEMGVFSRNTGNYKSTFDGLGFSITQITREAPAFAHSMTTGFMAISNNLPMLYDEIKKLRIANAALNAEGQKTPPIWKSVLKAGLSWNTAISTGIVLLTMYGKDIVEWVGKLIKGKEATNHLAEAQARLNEELGDAQGSTVKQIANIQTLSAMYQRLGDSVEGKTKFLIDYRKQIDETGVSVQNLNDADNLFVNNTDAYVASVKQRAESNVYYELYQEEVAKIIKNQEKLKNSSVTFLDKTNAFFGALTQSALQTNEFMSLYAVNIAANEEKQKWAIQGEISELKKLRDAREDAYITSFNKVNETLADAGIKTLEQIAAEEKARREAMDAARKAADEQNKRNEEYIKAVQDRLKAREEVAKAEVSGDEKLLAAARKNLENKTQAVEEASQKTLTINQAEKDALALQEYQSEKAIEKIHQDAAAKQEEEAKKRADAYMKDVDSARDAQKKLFEAKRKGNTDDIKLYEELLKVRQQRLEAHNQETFTLTEEQQEERQQKDAELNQVQIDEYIKQQDKLAELQSQYDTAKNIKEAQYFQAQIDQQQSVVNLNADILRSLGVQTEGLYQEKERLYKDDEKSLSDNLEKSLQTIKQYAGKTKSLFGNLSISVTSLLSKAFDAKKIKKEMDKMTAEGKEIPKEMEAQYKESTAQISTLAAAAAMATLDGVSTIINEGFEREKEAVEDFYQFQSDQAQRFYDDDLRSLDRQLKNKEISQARYTLEKLKLDDKQKEKEKKLERDKANALYDINLKQFRAKQAQDAIAVMIATAVAVMQTLASGGGFFSMPLVPIVTALGAIQVAAIYSQRPPERPKFEKGGLVDFQQIEGPSHAQGGVPVSIGGQKVAEVEGGEGALIVSKKAMRRRSMRAMLQAVEAMNDAISNGQSVDDMFADGGYLSYEDFFENARKTLIVTKKRGKKVWVNGRKYKLRDFGGTVDSVLDRLADDIAKPEYNDYVKQKRGEKETEITGRENEISQKIAGNNYFKSQGIKDIAEYNASVQTKQDESDLLDEKINAYKELKDAALEALKAEMEYDKRIADFDRQKTDTEEELSDKTLEFNERVLEELYHSGQIQKDEYLSLLDQVRNGYGAKTQDIINLKKKEVEAVKKLIEQERAAEISAANEVADYRTQALEQIRSEWEEQYNDITQRIIENVLEAGDAVSQLTGEDLDRYHQLLAISQQIEKMNEEYARNDSILNDGVIQSREEQARLVEEQKRIQEQLAIKEQEAEAAKAAFEELREKNMEASRKAFEAENFQGLLAQIKDLGSALQEEGNKWSLDKQITAELNESLTQINAKYDQQVAAQDSIISGLETEIEKAELLHDKKMANIKAEESAFKTAYEQRKKLIEQEYEKSTAQYAEELRRLNSLLSAIKVAGIAVGVPDFEQEMEKINEELQSLPTEKYAAGGAIDLGGGLFDVAGPSHQQGGVPVSVGGRKIAEVEGAEKMFVMNKMASFDPEMVAALRKASEVNARYSGVDFIEPPKTSRVEIDYDLLAEKIAQKVGREINTRPQPTYITYQEIGRAAAIAQMVKRASRME